MNHFELFEFGKVFKLRKFPKNFKNVSYETKSVCCAYHVLAVIFIQLSLCLEFS